MSPVFVRGIDGLSTALYGSGNYAVGRHQSDAADAGTCWAGGGVEAVRTAAAGEQSWLFTDSTGHAIFAQHLVRR